jgi:hypothetical protein
MISFHQPEGLSLDKPVVGKMFDLVMVQANPDGF